MRIQSLLDLHRLHLAHRRCHYSSLLAVFFSEDHWLVLAPFFALLGQLELDVVLVESADDIVHDLGALAWLHAGRLNVLVTVGIVILT